MVFFVVVFLSLYFSLETNKLIVNQLVLMYRNKENPKGARTSIVHFSDENVSQILGIASHEIIHKYKRGARREKLINWEYTC